MSTVLRITSDGRPIDLFNNTDDKFFVTRQINDIRSLNTRDGSFTRNLSLPATDNNVDIFFKIIPSSPIIRDVWIKLKVEVQLGGVPIFFQADLYVIDYLVQKKEIRTRIVGGNSVLFDAMETKRLVDADWADINFDWLAGDLSAISLLNTGNTYTIADMEMIANSANAFAKSNPLLEYRPMSAQGISLFYREIMKRLVESNGFTLDITDLHFDFVDDTNTTAQGATPEITILTIQTADGVDMNDFVIIGSVDLFVRGNSPLNADPMSGTHKYAEVLAVNQQIGFAEISLRMNFVDPTGTFNNYFPFKVELYNQIAMSLPVTQFVGGEINDPEPFDSLSDLTTTQVINVVGSTQIIGWTVNLDSPAGSWDDVAQGFKAIKDYPRGIRFKFDAPLQSGGGNVGTMELTGEGRKYFEINRNGNAIQSTALNNFGGHQTKDVFLPLDANDIITFSIRLMQEGDTVSILGNDGVTISGTSDIGIEVSITDYLPAISQKNMFAEICKTMNIVPEINSFTKTVFLNRFDKVFSLIDELNYNYLFGNVEDDIVQGEFPSGFIYAGLNAGAGGGLPDWSKKLDTSRTMSYFSYIPSWFKNNIFGWALGTNLNRQDTTGTFKMLNEQLKENGEKVRSVFGALDDSTLLLKGETEFADDVSINPKFLMGEPSSMGETGQINGTNTDKVDVTFTADDTPDVRAGDIILFKGGLAETDDDPRYITSVLRDGTGLPTQLSVNINYSAGTSVNSEWFIARTELAPVSPFRVCTVKRKDVEAEGFPWINDIDREGFSSGATFVPNMHAHFSTNLTWGNIIGTEYARMLKALETPVMVRAYFLFDPVEFSQIKMLRLVYVQPLNGLFYINKIEQYKANKPVRVELIRLNPVLKAGAISLPVGGDPLEVELEGLLTQ